MTQDEWLKKSTEWRKGCHAADNDMPFDDSKSKEWKDGYRFGLDNPFGSMYVPM